MEENIPQVSGTTYLIVIILILFFGAGGLILGKYLYSPKPPTDDNLPLITSNIIFKDAFGQIKIDFDGSNRAIKEQDGSYLLDQTTRKIYITYYSSEDELRPKLNTYKDSDGNNAGEGCFLSGDKITIAGLEFQKEYCYYNPISLTMSGQYDKDISSIIRTNCIAFLKRNDQTSSALKIDGEGPLEFDFCREFGNLINLSIEVSE